MCEFGNQLLGGAVEPDEFFIIHHDGHVAEKIDEKFRLDIFPDISLALGLDQVLPGRLADPAILEMGRRVVFRQADDLQARFPDECLARVRVFLRNGRTLTGPTLGARGDWKNPASDEELESKFDRLASRTLGDSAAKNLGQVIDTIDRRPAADLLSLLAPRGAA